jgi:hypothetical protein
MTDTTAGQVASDGLGPLPKQCGQCRTPKACSDGNCLEAYIVRRLLTERDCRTCKHWTPHRRSDVMHCSAAIRCVAGSSYSRQGVVQLWEATPVDAGF